MRMIKANNGFTLIEILVAAIIGVIATAAAVEVYVNQHKNWMIQEGVSDLQQNGRAAIDEIASRVRMAGYGVPEGLEAVVSRSVSGSTDQDSITLVFLREPVCTTSTRLTMPQTTADIECNGDISCFEDGQWCYISDPNTKTGEFFEVTVVQDQSGRVQHSTAALSKCYPAGSRLYTLDVVRYYVDDWTDTTSPVLVLQEFNGMPTTYADNICDLQIRYHMTDGSVLDTITMARYVRRIDIDVVARTAKEDLLLEDYRYDTLRTSVQVRNLAFQ